MENKTFEQLLKELQEIVNNLETGSLSLEESVEAYQKGMTISLECKKRLDQAKEVVVKKVYFTFFSYFFYIINICRSSFITNKFYFFKSF